MNWHYEKNGASIGPVADAQIQAARLRGEIQPSTRVWCEGWEDWKTAAEVWPSIGGGAATPPPIPARSPLSERCAECGSAQAGLVKVGGILVCENCKPLALTKLREGVPIGNSGSFTGPWSDGKFLVVSKNGPLPDCCVKCAAPSVTTVRKKLAWHEPAIYLTIFLGLIIYIIIALIVRKTATLDIPVCADCNASRKRNTAIATVAFLLSLVLLIFGATNMATDENAGQWMMAGAVLLLASLFWIVGTQFLLAKRINDRFVWIGKTSKEMLATLPRWPGE